MTYAGFGKRFLAFLIDILLVSFGAGLLLLIFTKGDLKAPDAENAANGLGLIVGWLYYATMESSSAQATVGKLALGIQVTDMNGKRIRFGRATGRHFSKIVSAICFMIGFLMIIFTEKQQGMHDKIADCLVVNKDSVMQDSSNQYQ